MYGLVMRTISIVRICIIGRRSLRYHGGDFDGVTCLECRHNMYLYNSTCVDQCPENYVAKHYGRTVANICELPLTNESIVVAWGNINNGGEVPPEIVLLKNIKYQMIMKKLHLKLWLVR